MLHVHGGSVELTEGVRFEFPSGSCCNCGSRVGVRTIEQDTRRTRYLFAGGTEVTFKLPLPFCQTCVPSSRRRPKSPVHWVLVALMLFGAAALGLIVLGDLVLHSAWVAANLLPLAAGIAVAMTLAMVAIARPKGTQTSYAQPVRIVTLRREFMSGAITGIGFAFTHAGYRKAFAAANTEAIRSGHVAVG